jgi:tRNA G37 N-methylase TrmD
MNIYIPWGLMAIFISLYIFYEHKRINRLRREERREELNSRRQEFLEKLVASKNKNYKNGVIRSEEDTP